MKIALDYDGTSADPAMWDQFILNALESGHEVHCVTMRYPTEPIAMSIPVFYTSRKAKASAFNADVWIDDKPQWLLNDSE